MSIDKKNLKFYDRNHQIRNCLLCGVVFIIMHFSYLQLSSENYASLGLYSLCVIIWSIFYLVKICKNSIISFKTFFILLLWVFHFGFFPLYLWGQEDGIMTIDMTYYSQSEVIKTFNIGIVEFYAFVLGFSFYSNDRFIKDDKSIIIVPESLVSIIKLLFTVLLIPYLVNMLINLMSSGYSDVLNRSSSGLLAYSNFILYTLSIFLFKKSVEKKNTLGVGFFYVLFAISSLTGQRIESVSLVITFLLIQYKGKKIRLKHIISFLCLLIVGLYFVHTIGMYRRNFSNMISQLLSINNFITFIIQNPFTSILQEFGGTVASLLGAVKYYDSGTYLYGGTYVAALTYVIPKLNAIFPSRYLTFIEAFPVNIAHGLGGSVIGELYANFGYYSILGGFCMSVVFSLFSSKISSKSNQENFYQDWWKDITVFASLLVIRGYFKNIIFLTFWGYIVYRYFTKKYTIKNQVIM